MPKTSKRKSPRKKSKSPRKKTTTLYPTIPHISRIAPNLYKFSKQWVTVKHPVVYENRTIAAAQRLLESSNLTPGDIDFDRVLILYLGFTADFGIKSDDIWDGLWDSPRKPEIISAWILDRKNLLTYEDNILAIELRKD